ncbi:MAG: hypothetical protein ACR2P1_22635 [Pseudomonadales bacterium]
MKGKTTKGKTTKSKTTKSKKSDAKADNYTGSKDDCAEARTVAARDPIRSKLQSEIEAFLAQGGQITQVEACVRADPPRKPTSNYGSQPI